MAEIQKVMDLFGAKEIIEIEDTGSIDFDKPIKGAYRCRIVELNRVVGEKNDNEYDFYSLSTQVEEELEGDRASNRYLRKTYSNTVSKWQDDAAEGKRRLMNDLFTAGLLEGLSIVSTDPDDAVAEIAPQIVDKMVNMRAYGNKGKQSCKIVKEFKDLKVKEETTTSDW